MHVAAMVLMLAQVEPATLDRLNQSIESLDQFCVDFQQVTFSDFFDDTNAEGTLCVQRPGKLKMTYHKGDKKVAICDGTTFFEYDYLAESSSRMDQSEIVNEPLVRIFLYGDSIHEYYLIDRYKNEEGADVFRFRSRTADVLDFEVAFDDQWQPTALLVITPDGEGTRFSFGTFKLEQSFGTQFFAIPERGAP